MSILLHPTNFGFDGVKGMNIDVAFSQHFSEIGTYALTDLTDLAGRQYSYNLKGHSRTLSA